MAGRMECRRDRPRCALNALTVGSRGRRRQSGAGVGRCQAVPCCLPRLAQSTFVRANQAWLNKCR
eukprot:35288-Chlamydomonas_euryale.AAC.1